MMLAFVTKTEIIYVVLLDPQPPRYCSPPLDPIVIRAQYCSPS
jgi:hypothetical protein